MTFRVRQSPLVAGAALLVAVACASVPFAHLRLTGISLFVPMALVVAAAAEFSTAVVLLATFVRTPRRATSFLAGSYVAIALLTFAQSTVIPLSASSAPLIHVAPMVSAWLYVAWHAVFAAGAIVYRALRRRGDAELPRAAAHRFSNLAVAAWVVAGIALIGAAALAATHLPHISMGSAPGIFVRSGVGPGLFALSLAAAGLLAAARRKDHIDIALTLVLLALTLDVGLHLLDDRRFMLAWYVSRLIAVSASWFVLVAAIRDLLDWRERAGRLQVLLADEARRAGNHAARLETLWRLGSSTLDDDAFLAALLGQASSVLREGATFFGAIAHLDGPDMIIDVVDEQAAAKAVLRPGYKFPVDDSLLGIVLRENRTISTSDVRTDARFAAMRSLYGIRSRAAIGTPFRVGPTTYVIGFVGVEPLAEPFSALDHAYLETLASFCATRLHQRAQLDRLRYQSEHDPLTGIYNRATFRGRSFAALRESERTALVVLDVDRFREINDGLGHQVGDAVLIEIAARLRAYVDEPDVVARLGSDTFGILMRSGDRRVIEDRMERLIASFREPFAAGDRDGMQRIAVTASAGVAIAPDDGGGFEQLLARADAAVFASKAAGRARWSFFDQRVEDRLLGARRMQTELAEALIRDQFVLHFQPTVELATGRVSGAEALLRWQHPERGFIPPADFIPFAEQHGMIGAIGAWVMRETVRLSRPWRSADPRLRVWFNLSAVELADPMLPARLATLDDDLAGIGVEITETAAMRNVHETSRAIAALRDAGLTIALDDFGTGYSSLAHLKRLPIDAVKIDRAFIDGIPGDAHDMAIVEAVVSIAQRYGFETVAEGVEHLEQASLLAAIGCTQAQGYAYARPMPAAAFGAWLAQRNIASRPS